MFVSQIFSKWKLSWWKVHEKQGRLLPQNHLSSINWRPTRPIYQEIDGHTWISPMKNKIKNLQYKKTIKKKITPQPGQINANSLSPTHHFFSFGSSLGGKYCFPYVLFPHNCSLNRWLLEEEAGGSPKSTNINLFKVYLHKYDHTVEV